MPVGLDGLSPDLPTKHYPAGATPATPRRVQVVSICGAKLGREEWDSNPRPNLSDMPLSYHLDHVSSPLVHILTPHSQEYSLNTLTPMMLEHSK